MNIKRHKNIKKNKTAKKSKYTKTELLGLMIKKDPSLQELSKFVEGVAKDVAVNQETFSTETDKNQIRIEVLEDLLKTNFKDGEMGRSTALSLIKNHIRQQLQYYKSINKEIDKEKAKLKPERYIEEKLNKNIFDGK